MPPRRSRGGRAVDAEATISATLHRTNRAYTAIEGRGPVAPDQKFSTRQTWLPVAPRDVLAPSPRSRAVAGDDPVVTHQTFRCRRCAAGRRARATRRCGRRRLDHGVADLRFTGAARCGRRRHRGRTRSPRARAGAGATVWAPHGRTAHDHDAHSRASAGRVFMRVILGPPPHRPCCRAGRQCRRRGNTDVPAQFPA